MKVEILDNKIIVDGIVYIPELTNEDNNNNLIKIVKSFEGFYKNSYKDPVGIWTIGYGTIKYKNGKKVQAGETITETQAIDEMMYELNNDKSNMYKYVKVKLNQNQEDALVSFIYNLGIGNFQKSTLLKKLNAGDYSSVPNEMMKWINAGGSPLKGLWRRRASESLLFIGEKNFIIKTEKVPSNWANMKYFSDDYKNLV